jgi:hypothetical protein
LGFLTYDDEHNFHINPVIAQSINRPKIVSLDEYLKRSQEKATKIPRRSLRLKAKKGDGKGGRKSR